MISNSTKTRFTALTARLFVLLIAVCMLIAVAPHLSGGFSFRALADLPSKSSSSVSEINSFLSSNTGEVNVLLNGNVDLNGGGIVVPNGLTVNFYMNGKTMTYEKDNWNTGSFNAITVGENAVLNVYSGSVAVPNLTSGNSLITVKNERRDMSANSHNETAFVDVVAIKNSGTVTVNKNVKINVHCDLDYGTGGSSQNNSNVNSAATGIYNATNSASATINAVEITSYANAYGVNANGTGHTYRPSTARAYSYGIYGGKVTVNGDSKLSVRARLGIMEHTWNFDFGEGKQLGVAFGVCSGQKITVNGGNFEYSSEAVHQNDGMKKGLTRVYMGGIAYSSQVPVLTDGTITPFNGSVNQINKSDHTFSIFEATVGKMTALPISGAYFVANIGNFGSEGYDHYPNGTNSKGQFQDEADNTYNASSSVSDGSHPTKIERGAAEGSYRVHVVYRYWTDQNKNTVDTSIEGTEGNKGYSYKPLGDNTNIVETTLKLNGLSGTNQLLRTSSSSITYNSGGVSKNDYYWKQFNVTYSNTSNWFSDYDVSLGGPNGHRGTIFKSFVDSTNLSVPSAASSVYIFMDYYRVSPSTVKGSVGSDNSATVTYTGDPIKASALGTEGLRIKQAVSPYTDYTNEYDIDFTGATNKIPVSFTWTGTNAAQNSVSGSGELPVDAGTYNVTLEIADSREYDPNDCDPNTHKNRYALSYSFTLTITQVSVVRNDLPETVTLTYGERLNEALSLNTYVAKGPKNENVPGVFSFTNPQDGTAFKTVGTNTVSITWTPTYAASAPNKNYCVTTFTVTYTVEKAALVISPKAAEVTYGETEFNTPYSIAVTGFVANDDNDENLASVASSIDYMILFNNDFVYYSPDDIPVGSYDIRGRVDQARIPAVLSNYTYSYADLVSGYTVNQLTVQKRGLTVTATPVSRAYEPDNYTVSVTYEVTGGRYSADDVRFTTGTGSIAYCTAGTQVVGGVTTNTVSEMMTGGKADCYKVSEIVYSTGTQLTVEITKAIPSVATPTVDDVYYQRTRTLASIPLTGSYSSVEGSWSWANPSVNPSVAVTAYSAKFVPSDNANYETRYVDVSINVLPTPVKITYNNTVEYGDPIPNITAYSYTHEMDPSFSIDAVETTGNITPHTSYTQGSAVSAEGYPVTISLQNYADVAGNYTFTAQDGKITVTPRNIEFTVPDVSITYGDNFAPTATNVPLTFDESRLVGEDTVNSLTANGAEPQWIYNTSYLYQSNYQVGTYSISATPNFTTSSNYTVSVKNGTLTVNKAPLTIRANDVTLPYNSEVPADLNTNYTLIGVKRNEPITAILTSGTITVDTYYTKGSPVNVEGYPITVDISQAVFNNYTVTTENARIIVIKATPEVRTLPTASIVYGQTLGDAVFTGGEIYDDVPGSFAYNSATTKPAYSSTPYTNYTASYIPADTNNYNTVTGLIISLTVNKMPVTGALAVTGLPMVGETLTVDVSGMNPDTPGAYVFTWTAGGAVVGTGESLTLTGDLEGSSLTVTAVAQSYYDGELTYTVTTVAPVLPSVADIIKNTAYFDLAGLNGFDGTTEITYDAVEHDVTLQQKGDTLSTTVVGTVTVKYNGSTTIPKDAGLYNITVDVETPDLSRVNEAGVTTYSPATGLSIGALKINKAPYSVTVTVADKVYDGYNTASAASVVETGAMTLSGGAKDDVAFDRDHAVFTFADANVGEDKTVAAGNEALIGSAAGNYELEFTLANGAKADITARTLEVTVVPVARQYEENNVDVDLTFTVNTATIAPADSSSDVYVNEALARGTAEDFHAGLRRVTVSNVELAGSKKDNYVLSLVNAADLTVEIEKATPSYPLPATGIVYYDSGRTLSNISLGDSRWAWADSVKNVIPEAGTHNFTAVYTPDDTDNYASVNYDVALNVRKAPVSIKAASFNTVYGDYAPTYYYTVTGLTGADTIRTSVGGYVIMSCSYEPGAEVGEYSIVLSGGFTSNNYTFTYQNGTITVNPRPAYVTAIAESRQYQSGNTNVNVTFSELSNIFAADGTNVYLGGTQPVIGTIPDDNAGTKVVSYTLPELAGSKAGNYVLTLLNPELKVEIAKAVLEGVVLPTTGTVKYGAKLSTTEFTSSYSGTELGIFSMEDPMSTPAAVGTTNNVYKVIFTPYNTINFATISDYITLTVVTADLNVDLSMAGSAEVGKVLYVATNDLPADAYQYIEFRWYRMDSRTADVHEGTLVATGTTEYTVTEKDADHYIVCVAVNKANSPYNISGRVGSEGAVSKKSMSLWERILKWFYKVMASISQLFGRI